MAFSSASNCKLSDLGLIAAGSGNQTGGSTTATSLRADCANSGSATDVSLWDDFKASGTVTVTPSNESVDENSDWDVKIVPATVGTFWDTRIGGNANNYNDGFNFSASQTQGDDSSVKSGYPTRPRGDTARYQFEFGDSEEHAFPQITVTAQINDTAGAGGATYIVGDWLNGDSAQQPTVVATIIEEPE